MQQLQKVLLLAELYVPVEQLACMQIIICLPAAEPQSSNYMCYAAAAAAGGVSCLMSGVQMTCCQARLSRPLICCNRAPQACSGSAMQVTAQLTWAVQSQVQQQQQQGRVQVRQQLQLTRQPPVQAVLLQYSRTFLVMMVFPQMHKK
jgi:hypothetical protein